MLRIKRMVWYTDGPRASVGRTASRCAAHTQRIGGWLNFIQHSLFSTNGTDSFQNHGDPYSLDEPYDIPSKSIRPVFRLNRLRTVQTTATFYTSRPNPIGSATRPPTPFHSPPPAVVLRRKFLQYLSCSFCPHNSYKIDTAEKILKFSIFYIFRKTRLWWLVGYECHMSPWPSCYAVFYWRVWMTHLSNVLSYGRKIDPSVSLKRFLSADRSFGKSQFKKNALINLFMNRFQNGLLILRGHVTSEVSHHSDINISKIS